MGLYIRTFAGNGVADDLYIKVDFDALKKDYPDVYNQLVGKTTFDNALYTKDERARNALVALSTSDPTQFKQIVGLTASTPQFYLTGAPDTIIDMPTQETVAAPTVAQAPSTVQSVKAPPVQSNYTSTSDTGEVTFDSTKYKSDLVLWQTDVSALGFNPDTFDPLKGTISGVNGEQFGVYKNQDGTYRFLNQADSAAENKRMATTQAQFTGPNAALMQRVIATTGIDPATIGQPKIIKDAQGRSMMQFESAQQLAWYTGYVTEQAKMEYEKDQAYIASGQASPYRVAAPTSGVAIAQNRQTAQQNEQARIGLQQFVASNPAAGVQLGDLIVQKPKTYNPMTGIYSPS